MYIEANMQRYPCARYYQTATSVTFSGIEGLTLPVAGIIDFCLDNGHLLAPFACADYSRQIYADGVLTLTNEPEPEPVPEPEPIEPPPTLTERVDTLETQVNIILGVAE